MFRGGLGSDGVVQLTTLLAVVIFPGVGQEAFMFAIIITAAPLESLPHLTCCSTR